MSHPTTHVGAGKIVCVFVVVVLLWGSTFIAVKHCLAYWSVWQTMAGRYVIGAFLLMPVALMALRREAHLYLEKMTALVHLAVVGSLMPVGLMTWAQLNIPSGFAGVIASLSPMMALVAGVVFFKSPSRPLHWAGVLLGSIGVAILYGAGPSGAIFAQKAYSVYSLAAALMATVCWGLAAQHYRRHLAHFNPIHVTALSFQIMGMIMLCMLAYQAASSQLRTNESWLPMIYLLGLAMLSVVAVTGYNWLIVRWGAMRASSCTYVVPLVALFWGVLDAEPLSWNVLVAIGIISVAMWAVRQPVQTSR